MDTGRSTLEHPLRPPLVYRRHTFLWRHVPSLLDGARTGMHKTTTLCVQPVSDMNALEVYLTQAGSIANLTIQPQKMPTRALAAFEAISNVRAVGLNFRDVLNVLGLDPTGMVRPIGGEAAGIISNVGPACGHVLESEHAYGLVPGGLRTHAWCDARYIRCTRYRIESRRVIATCVTHPLCLCV